MAKNFYNTVLVCLLIFELSEVIHSSYMKKLHAKVNNAGYCVMAELTGTVYDNVESNIQNCNASSAGFSDDQESWLEGLGKQIRPKDWTGVSPVVRKEVRQYSDSEWSDVVRAITSMQHTMIGDTSQYGIFVKLHQHDVGPSGTRAGPGSWGWHREYLARFEKAMQQHVPGVSLPYWDVSLDAYLPYFNSTVYWSNDLLGACGSGLQYDSLLPSEVFADVTDGQFSNWRVAEPCATSMVPNNYDGEAICAGTADEDEFEFGHYMFSPCYTRRSCNVKHLTDTFNDAELEYALTYRTFSKFSYDLCLLDDHDGLHVAVGGTSGFDPDKSCAVADPVMWFMHTYLDYIWELFRQKSQTTDLEKDYMEDSQILECHRYNSEMTPFTELKNSDGLDKLYTKYHYIYQENPISCDVNRDCATELSSEDDDPKYLWCDTSVGRCKSKVKVGTTCKHLTDDACEAGSSCSKETNICVRKE